LEPFNIAFQFHTVTYWLFVSLFLLIHPANDFVSTEKFRSGRVVLFNPQISVLGSDNLSVRTELDRNTKTNTEMLSLNPELSILLDTLASFKLCLNFCLSCSSASPRFRSLAEFWVLESFLVHGNMDGHDNVVTIDETSARHYHRFCRTIHGKVVISDPEKLEGEHKKETRKRLLTTSERSELFHGIPSSLGLLMLLL
jgi:hypothetical protein